MGKMDDILYEKEPIELKDIIHLTKVWECKRKVVLLEGAPGYGKNTLSVFIKASCLQNINWSSQSHYKTQQFRGQSASLTLYQVQIPQLNSPRD